MSFFYTDFQSNAAVVVVMPLKALMEQQHAKTCSAGYRSRIVSDYSSALSALSDGVTYIFISPEALSSSPMKAAQVNRTAAARISYVFVDESHCVVKW